jgi:hypothetical protein
LAGSKISFSVWIFSDSAARLRIHFGKAVTDNTFTGVTNFHEYEDASFDNSGTWQEIKIEDIDVPADAEHGISVTILFDDFQNITGSRNHRVAAVMMNEGRSVSRFAMSGDTIEEEFANCQRYYELARMRVRAALTSGSIEGTHRFAVDKRATPSITLSTGTLAGVDVYSLSVNSTAASFTCDWTADSEIS